MDYSAIFATNTNDQKIIINTVQDLELCYFYHMMFNQLDLLFERKDYSTNQLVMDNLKTILDYDYSTKTATITFSNGSPITVSLNDLDAIIRSQIYVSLFGDNFFEVINLISNKVKEKTYTIFDVENCGFRHIADTVILIEYKNEFYYMGGDFYISFYTLENAIDFIEGFIDGVYDKQYHSFMECRWDTLDEYENDIKLFFNIKINKHIGLRVIDGYKPAGTYIDVEPSDIMRIHELDTTTNIITHVKDFDFSEPEEFITLRKEFSDRMRKNNGRTKTGQSWFKKLFG